MPPDKGGRNVFFTMIDRSIPNVPEIRADMMAYFAVLGAMCDRMLPPFAAALGLCGDFFAPFFADEAHAVVRFLHYPPQETTEDNTFGQAPHTDNSFMTALARTDVPGLAVRLPSGEWFAPPVIPGTFLINLGNIMRRWSNDRFLSTPHGVLNESRTDRYSIAYFYSPNPNAVIECVPSCATSDDPPRYPPAVYRDLVLEFCRANIFIKRDIAPQLPRKQPRTRMEGASLFADVGGDRHLHGARGQHLLAPPAGRGWRPHRSRRGKVAGGNGTSSRSGATLSIR